MSKVIQRHVKRIFTYQLTITAVTAAALFLYAPQQAVLFVCGALVISLNFFALYILWKRVFDKKPVALTLGLIITKYAVLLIILYVIVMKWSQQLPAFLVGLSTIIASFLLLAVNIAITEKK